MSLIDIKKGIEIPEILLPLPRECGLDVWLSKDIENWVANTLEANVNTITIKENSNICAIVLAFRDVLPGIRLASGYPYSTILGDVDLFWRQFNRLKIILKKHGVSRVELALSGSQTNRVLTPMSEKYVASVYFKTLNAVRHIVDLTYYKKPNELFKTLNGKLRWSIRKAEKNGVRISKVELDSIDTVQELYIETMSDINAPINYTKKRFEIILRELSPNKLGNVFLAHYNSQPISMAAVVDSKITRHLIQIATPKKFRSTRVSDYLIWNLIKEALEIDKNEFDFMASSSKDITLTDYKKKWNSREEKICHVVLPLNQIRSRLVDQARALNRALKSNKSSARK